MQMTYLQAVGAALQEEMRRDDKIVMFGEDIAQFGNIFGVTRGMLEEFGPQQYPHFRDRHHRHGPGRRRNGPASRGGADVRRFHHGGLQ